MSTNTASIAQLASINTPVSTRTISWLDMAQRAWGSEFKAPDHATYVFSGGRKFDSTDTGSTGIYAGGADNGQLLAVNGRSADMFYGGLLADNGDRLVQG